MKKIITITLFLMLTVSIFSKMNVFVDVNRFKDIKGHTRYEIAYQIPYNELSFQRVKNGYRALIKITLSLEKNGKIVYNKPLLRQLFETEDVTTENGYSYQDKLHFSLSKPGFKLLLKFKDLVGQDSLDYSKNLINLKQNDVISDLELDNQVVIDTTDYKKNFHRGKVLYIGYQNHAFDKVNNDTLYIYYELYKTMDNPEKIKMTVLKDDKTIINKDFNNIKLINEINHYLYGFNIAKFDAGYYDLVFQIFGKDNKFLTERKNFFIVKEHKMIKQLVFYDIVKDKKLVEYFLNSKQKKILRSLNDKDAINNFISKFWLTHDFNPATPQNEFLEVIKKRVDYANKNFSSFSKGWETDRGRIYIKYGLPDFKKKYKTDSSSKYPFKNYEVWQYRSKRDQSYIFFDMQANGSYRLIYSENDPTENSYPNWKNFVGEEFELNDLE